MNAGYAAAATDAGVGASPLDGSGSSNPVNTPLLQGFASRSRHDMAVVGKDVARRFYGKPVTYAYWNGCSTGGRQGYEEAQDYPSDFDGILAKTPAINWDRFAVVTLWSQAVFNEEKVAPTQCELDAFPAAAIQVCETLDGSRTASSTILRTATGMPGGLVGTTVVCEGKEITIPPRAPSTTASVSTAFWAATRRSTTSTACSCWLAGMIHCQGGTEPQPTDDLTRSSTLGWRRVRAPATLAAATPDGSVTHNICQSAHH
ncbi:tannase/feruloyl esterase family alpha/beta hydrolase [Micromonospora sp. NPDC048999]|uniref:tannase/feruloyl esterase family alpha/beta hydrolase n=1 Tax=Micromonospora sp. NPDC048999 TaxID=3155391 RepID=UPI0033CDC510